MFFDQPDLDVAERLWTTLEHRQPDVARLLGEDRVKAAARDGLLRSRLLLMPGMTISNAKPFTSPIGTHFPAGEMFVVEVVGQSTRCRHERTGSVVWVQGNRTSSSFAGTPLQYRVIPSQNSR